MDNLTLTIRMHDPLEKKDPAKSTAWAVRDVPREDLALSVDDFVAKYIKPMIVDGLHEFLATIAAPATPASAAIVPTNVLPPPKTPRKKNGS